VEREPPPITITNPATPAGGDVVGAEPWRPSPGQKRVALVVAAVLVVVGGTAAAVRGARRDSTADRAVLAAVRLAADDSPDIDLVPDGYVRMGVRNDGPGVVTLLGARLLPGGYGDARMHEELDPQGVVSVVFRDSARCGPALLTHPPTAVRVRLRTSRGTVTTRELTLSPGAFDAVTRPPRERCGYLLAGEAFDLGFTSVTLEHGTVVARATVHDNGVLPLTLQRLREAPGLSLTVSPALPLVLPPQPRPDTVTNTVEVTLRLRVTRCDIFLSAIGYPQVGGGVQLVRGWVRRDGVDTEVPVLMAGAAPPTGSSRPPAQASVLGDLLDRCRSFVIDHAPGYLPEQP